MKHDPLKALVLELELYKQGSFPMNIAAKAADLLLSVNISEFVRPEAHVKDWFNAQTKGWIMLAIDNSSDTMTNPSDIITIVGDLKKIGINAIRGWDRLALQPW